MRLAVSVPEPLRRELWTSWASLLRSYSAAHGLNRNHQAVVEVGADEIILRVGDRWMRFTRDAAEDSRGNRRAFSLEADGRVRLDNEVEEMDLAAEKLAREMMLSESDS